MTEPYHGLDPELYRGLDQDVAESLIAWAEMHGRHYALDRWLVNGRSRQPVAVVRETLRDPDPSTTMLVLKVLSAPSDAVRTLEYARHRQARHDAPEFAAGHLSTFVHDAAQVPGHRWVTFQRIAAHSLENTEVLTVLLRRMVGLSDDMEPPHTRELGCKPETFTDACRSIVAGVLGEWAGRPFIPPHEQWSPATFFRWHLTDQLNPGGRLFEWANEHRTDLIRVHGEPNPLPNPFAMAEGRLLADTVITPLVGRSHGDLHTDNALIRVRPQVDTTDYFLIDTALYESVGPLTRDPAHLLLYIIARSMEAISPTQQSALIDLILDPLHGPAHQVPGWLATLIQGIDSETRTWVEESGLAPHWREQTYLSLAACAMLFLGRTSTREADKVWFLRLAGRAVAKFAAEHNVRIGGSIANAAPTPSSTEPQPVSSIEAATTQTPHHPTDPVTTGTPEPRARKKRAKYVVNANEAQGVQIGDRSTQHNNFR